MLALVLVIVLWAVLVDLYDIPHYVLPSPMQVWEHIQKDWLALLAGFRTTFLEFLFGFLIGAAAGFVFAVIMDASRSARGILYPILITSQAIPVVAISAALDDLARLRPHAQARHRRAGDLLPGGRQCARRPRLGRPRPPQSRALDGRLKFSIFRHVKLPATYSPLFSALKLSATFAVTGAVIAEWTASTSGGLGAYLLQANSRLNTAGTFSAIAFLALLGVVSFPARRRRRISADAVEIIVEGTDLVAGLLARRAS